MSVALRFVTYYILCKYIYLGFQVVVLMCMLENEALHLVNISLLHLVALYHNEYSLI